MKGLLFTLMPDGILPVVLVFLGLALILGIVSRKSAFNFVGIIILFALLSPFVVSLFDSFPTWLVLLVFGVVLLSLARGVLSSLFGKGATDQFVGQVMYAVFALPFRLLGNLFRRRRI